MQEIVKKAFPSWLKCREIGEEAGTVTLSIGVGGWPLTGEGEAMAVQAMDYGRCGRGRRTQAAGKSAEGLSLRRCVPQCGKRSR